MKKNSKKKSCRRCRLPVDATHPQQSFAAAALLLHTNTHAHNVSCTLCVYRESERLPPTQTRALFLAGMLLLLACRWRSVHLCTCPSLSLWPSLCVSALYLQFPFVQFRRVERSFLFLFYFFLNHLTRLPGGCNITTTTNSRDTGHSDGDCDCDDGVSSQ